MTVQTLILARYVIPVRPGGQVLENYGLIINQDRIAGVLPAAEAIQKYPDAEIVKLSQHVVMPGLINAHNHSPMTLLRGFADDLDLQSWLNDYIWPTESRYVDPDFVLDGARLAVAEMIRSGTTCFIDQYFYPEHIARVVMETGMRASIGLPILDQATPWARHFEEYVERGLEVANNFREEKMISFSLAPHAPYSVSDPGLEKIAEISADTQMRVDMHCLETTYDVKHSLETYGIRPLDRLAGHGLLNDSLLAIHMTQLLESDYSIIAESGMHIAHCPQSNLKLASGICPVTDLLSAGVNVCVGTDGAASNNNLDLLKETRFAALLAKGVSGDPTAVNAEQALEMITFNPAKALGLEQEIGTIEVGKQADLCAMNLDAIQTQPLHNLFSQIIYAASSSQFSDVWIAGKRVMKNNELLTVSEPDLIAVAGSWQARLSDRTGYREQAQ